MNDIVIEGFSATLTITAELRAQLSDEELRRFIRRQWEQSVKQDQKQKETQGQGANLFQQ